MPLPCRLFLIAIAFVCLSVPAGAKARVGWLSLEGSPKRAASGVVESNIQAPAPGEQARRWLVERLPGFLHRQDTASVARIEQLVAAGGETYCYANALRTPQREATALFSDAVLHRLPSRVIIRADRQALLKPHLNDKGQVQLRSLVGDRKLLGAVTIRRNYGPLIDPVLSGAADIQRVSHYDTPSRMLMARHTDWIISEPAALRGLVDNDPSLPRTPTRSFEVAGPSALVVTYAMCSRTDTGRAVVNAINRLMANHVERPWERPYVELLDGNERADLARMLQQQPR
ncbi:hypothetical protein J7U46_19295 [Pelomonas sp. V22]|uniref:hypothetical protein n=1 Tax=Pelomonas sp. V22 TaxID=2822139 RepID=UPI0024A84D4D|nr:hypothetical protein [Pelomonas sp. V22]MDI4635217.1 hypothetical protein [Pelomonas sp. V22]